MKFRFSVKKVGEIKSLDVYHLFGVVEKGVILPPIEAFMEDNPSMRILIDSIALVDLRDGVKAPTNTTLVIKKPDFDIKLLEGCTITNQSKE
jgi:hypothetical protein